eukprot:gene2314-2782_t
MSKDLDWKKIEETTYVVDPYEFQKNSEWGGNSVVYEFVQKFYSGELTLSNLRVPSFCVKPIAFLEQHADFSYPFKYLRQVSEMKDPLDRIIAITRHYLNTNKLGMCSGFAGAAPNMPMVGEQFICSWKHKDSTSYFVGEQVTEDILVSSVENPEKNISIINCGSKKGGFWGNSAGTYSKGGARLTITSLNEIYDVTFPGGIARGLVWGKARLEPFDKLTIKSPNHEYTTDVTISDGGYILGYIYKGKKCLKKIYGALLDDIHIENYSDYSNKEKLLPSSRPEKLFHLKTVESLENQKDHESRKLWSVVHHSTVTKDYDTLEKARDEMEQKKEKAKENHQSKVFEKTDELFNEVFRYKLNIDNHPFKEKLKK